MNSALASLTKSHDTLQAAIEDVEFANSISRIASEIAAALQLKAAK